MFLARWPHWVWALLSGGPGVACSAQLQWKWSQRGWALPTQVRVSICPAVPRAGGLSHVRAGPVRAQGIECGIPAFLINFRGLQGAPQPEPYRRCLHWTKGVIRFPVVLTSAQAPSRVFSSVGNATHVILMMQRTHRLSE